MTKQKICTKCRSQEHRENGAHWRRKQHYGLSRHDYATLLDQQSRRCKVCGCPEEQSVLGRRRGLVVDHDHKSGKVRGLLCWHCNLAIGHAKDDVKILKRLLEYLRQ